MRVQHILVQNYGNIHPVELGRPNRIHAWVGNERDFAEIKTVFTSYSVPQRDVTQNKAWVT